MNIDTDIAQEYILKGYIAMRLQPLEGVAGISKNRINNVTDFLYTHHIDNEYTIDTMVNAIFNYINATGCCPSDKLLTDDIETLLDDYVE